MLQKNDIIETLKNKYLIKNTMLITAGNIMLSIAGFLFWILASRIVGIDTVGLASVIISIASIATLITSSGLEIVALREPTFDRNTIYDILATSLVISMINPLLIYLLGKPVNLNIYIIILASLIAQLIILSKVALNITISLEKFRDYIIMTTIASITKILSIILIIIYPSIYTLLVSFTTSQIILISYTLQNINIQINRKPNLIKILKHMIANYPITISNNIIIAISTYFYAIISNNQSEVGFLYISLMIVAMTSMVAYAAASVFMHIAKTRSTTFANIKIIIFAISVIVSLFIVREAKLILSLVNPSLLSYLTEFTIIILSIVPVSIINIIQIEFNMYLKIREIVLIGLSRLLTLLLLYPILVQSIGLKGAAISYTVANMAALATYIIIEAYNRYL